VHRLVAGTTIMGPATSRFDGISAGSSPPVRAARGPVVVASEASALAVAAVLPAVITAPIASAISAVAVLPTTATAFAALAALGQVLPEKN